VVKSIGLKKVGWLEEVAGKSWGKVVTTQHEPIFHKANSRALPDTAVTSCCKFLSLQCHPNYLTFNLSTARCVTRNAIVVAAF